jgi:hypothetical protein
MQPLTPSSAGSSTSSAHSSGFSSIL